MRGVGHRSRAMTWIIAGEYTRTDPSRLKSEGLIGDQRHAGNRTRSKMMTTRRDFFVLGASALAAETLLGDQSRAAGRTQAAEMLYLSANGGADSNPGTKDKPL